MAKNDKKAAPRKTVRTVAITTAAPIIKMGATVLFGRGTTNGAISVAKSAGMSKGLARAANLAMSETIGFWPALNDGGSTPKGWDLKPPVENLTIAGAGYVAHKVAEKAKMNSTLRRWGSPLVV